jgi:hypothetical protein
MISGVEPLLLVGTHSRIGEDPRVPTKYSVQLEESNFEVVYE